MFYVHVIILLDALFVLIVITAVTQDLLRVQLISIHLVRILKTSETRAFWFWYTGRFSVDQFACSCLMTRVLLLLYETVID